MGTHIASGHIIGRGTLSGLETPKLAEWEYLRSCVVNNASKYFDIDASYGDHLLGAAMCAKCPVFKLCRQQAERKRDAGLYAGMMYDGSQRPAMYVPQFHKKRKPDGTEKTSVKAGNKRNAFPPGWTEERKCPGCHVIFTVTSRNVAKKYHSEACRRAHIRKKLPEWQRR